MVFIVLVTILCASTFPPLSCIHSSGAFLSPWQCSKSRSRTKSLQGFPTREPLKTQCSIYVCCNETRYHSYVIEKRPPALCLENWTILYPSSHRLTLSRRVWKISRVFTTYLRRHWKKHVSAVPLMQLHEVKKSIQSTVFNFLVAVMIYWNVFLGIIPTSPPPFQQHVSSSESLISVLTNKQTRCPTLDAQSNLAHFRDLVAGRSIEVEKERKVKWQQRQHKDFPWDACPEDGYLGLGYPNSPRFIVRQLSEHRKATSQMDKVKSSSTKLH
jgi:hypothetical protein